MADNEPHSEECDPDIFQNGEPVVLIDAGGDEERWVKEVAALAGARLDWHISGGTSQVLHLGDDESRQRVDDAISKLEGSLKGRIMRRIPVGAPGLYRKGVSPIPAGAVAAFYDGNGGSAYIIS